MTPANSRAAQIEKYREMSCEERLLVGLRLHELSCELAREGIRLQAPTATDQQIEETLRQRIRLSYRIAEKANIE